MCFTVSGLNVWWVRTDELDEASVDDSGPAGCPELFQPVPLSSCEFTEQDRDDVEVPTRCKPCYTPSAKEVGSGAKEEL